LKRGSGAVWFSFLTDCTSLGEAVESIANKTDSSPPRSRRNADQTSRQAERRSVMKTLAMIPLALGIVLAAVPAARADDTSCTEPLSGAINGNVVVPEGATCSLHDATVTGNVLVGKGARLLMIAGPVTIAGDLLGIQCDAVEIHPEPSSTVSIGGSVGLLFCTGQTGLIGYKIDPPVNGLIIHGNFLCQFNSAPCDAWRGSIGGNANVSQNSGGESVVLGNEIDGNLVCLGNTAVIDGGIPNRVAGRKLGQCADL